MPLFRVIFLIAALLVQALPLPVRAEDQPMCPMACCAVATTCCCAEPADAPALPAPASTPPVTGRELVPAVLWVAFTTVLPLEKPAAECKVRPYDSLDGTQPHVRLPVLFCSFLI